MKITNALLAAILVAATVVDGIPTMRFRSEKKSTAGAAGDETTAATYNEGLSLACKDSAYLEHGYCWSLRICNNETEYLEKKKTSTSDRVCKRKLCTCSDPHGTGFTGADCPKNGTEACGDCKQYKKKNTDGTCVDSTEGSLEVELKRCKCSNSDGGYFTGESDVYCEVWLRDAASGKQLMYFMTETIDNDNSPTFNYVGRSDDHDFSTPVRLALTCYDEDLGYDDSFGTNSVELPAIVIFGTGSTTIKMTSGEEKCDCDIGYELTTGY